MLRDAPCFFFLSSFSEEESRVVLGAARMRRWFFFSLFSTVWVLNPAAAPSELPRSRRVEVFLVAKRNRGGQHAHFEAAVLG